MQVNHLYQALNGHVSLEEVKLLKNMLSEQNDSQRMDGAIDTDDLFDAIELHSDKLKQDSYGNDGGADV